MKKETATQKSSRQEEMQRQYNKIIQDRLARALPRITAPQQYRLLQYIHEHPDCFTHEIAMNCGIGFPPARAWELNHEVLPHYGLFLHCHKPPKWLKNRYGEDTHVHQWRLVLREEMQEAA